MKLFKIFFNYVKKEVREDIQNRTVLHLAVSLGRADIVPLLLSIYSPAAKLSDSHGHNPLDIAKDSENDQKPKEGKLRIVKMLENIDSTIKKYVEETGARVNFDGDVDMAETRHFDDGRVVTKDGKISERHG